MIKFRELIKTAVANQSGAMEAYTISKHGRNSKSQTSRKNVLWKACFSLLVFFVGMLSTLAQVIEPEFIGEAFLIKSDSSHRQLDKEVGKLNSKMSMSSNSWDALFLEIDGSKAQTRLLSSEQPLQIVVRAAENNSDPISIIDIYKFNNKKNRRSVELSASNAGLNSQGVALQSVIGKSGANSKDLAVFSGIKYGTSSYLLTLNNLKPGEYGIIVRSPNSSGEKMIAVYCFAID